MSDVITVPKEFQNSLRRLYPYMISSLRTDREAMEKLLLYLKVGDEKLARIAIEAMNADYRLQEAALKRKQREESMLREQSEDLGAADETDEDLIEDDLADVP